MAEQQPKLECGHDRDQFNTEEKCLKCIYQDSIKVYEDFFTEEECDYIVKLSQGSFERSFTGGDQKTISDIRTSYSAFFDGWDNKRIRPLYDRVAKLMKINAENIEPFQCVSYEDFQYYKPHLDAFDIEGSDKTLMHGGQRWGTLLVYLTDDYKGGETYFPEIGYKVKPKKGKAIFFFNLDDKGNRHPYSLHTGLPVYEGKKYACNIWLRENSFR
ncbi:2OG-Fe(II) oxygenase (plasmid) [Aureibacter tunicatorum]|nr:2OG-Fe(II) oxygenase [Aureibacter tunicatorum]